MRIAGSTLGPANTPPLSYKRARVTTQDQPKSLPPPYLLLPHTTLVLCSSSVFFFFWWIAAEPGGLAPELANQGEIILEVEEKNKRLVRALYEALNNRDVETVHRLLAPNIEWWFHGPPSCQHMMRLLTGASPDNAFLFDPVSIAAFGSTVLVEGQGYGLCTEVPVPWIHAWTVTDGIITQVREYFNTSLTVTRLDAPESSSAPSTLSPSGSGGSNKSRASSSSTSQFHCAPLWQSKLSGGAGKKSVPGLVLAI
ncbi:hypothetical protein Taro_056101 [Colocasia esculenta]|uniref:Wound-induced protein 1 n=1 Tax=Colocasia esculenta TaxID=4460 RepID=A0A843XVL2_COLES|nr:hypothetical protein [Colocasia esculenta]